MTQQLLCKLVVKVLPRNSGLIIATFQEFRRNYGMKRNIQKLVYDALYLSRLRFANESLAWMIP